MNASEKKWRELLSEKAFEVTRQGGTERPFTGKYWDCKEDGVYECICCASPLFSSEAKFDSGTGWPSFHSVIDTNAVAEKEDSSHGMRRIEACCSSCDAHLGHVFPDGPKPTGLRYCINSASLALKKTKS